MPTQKKIDIVTKLKEKLDKAKSVFLTDYRGLTHQQLEDLRKSLKKIEADFAITKNRLLKIALKDWNNNIIDQFEEHLKNPTATLFSYGDEIAPIRQLSKFIKNFQLPKIKIGLFEGKLATAADFKKLASLPSREILLSTLIARMQSPISGLQYALNWNVQKLVIALNQIKDKKPNSPSNAS